MLALSTSALALLVPTPPAIVQPAPQVRIAASVLVADANPLVFPATTTIGGLIQEGKNADVYSGAQDSLSLSEMLDNIPVSDLDLHGAKGMKADAQGLKRLEQRKAVEAEKAFDKYQEVLAKEARMAELGLEQ